MQTYEFVRITNKHALFQCDSKNCSVGDIDDMVGVIACKKYENRLDCDDVEIRK